MADQSFIFSKMSANLGKYTEQTSFSFSRRYFNWRKKIQEEDCDDEMWNGSCSSSSFDFRHGSQGQELNYCLPRKKPSVGAVSKLKSALTLFSTRNKTHFVGTMFGHRRGHAHFAIQETTTEKPAFVIQLPMPTSVLVREMASGLVRIALECDKKTVVVVKKRNHVKLLEEPLWRTYCNGRKYGYAIRKECGEKEMKVLKAVEMVSVGAGVMPEPEKRNEDGSNNGELMYMRAKFERIIGSKDSEAFYMMNPDANGGPELSIYFTRVL